MWKRRIIIGKKKNEKLVQWLDNIVKKGEEESSGMSFIFGGREAGWGGGKYEFRVHQ